MNPARHAALLLWLLTVASASAEEPLDAAFEQDVLVIVANEHACHRFDIYLAVGNAQQRRGLMFVRELPERSGMLFVYESEDFRSMWMKNTFIPLDIMFARKDGTIINVVQGTEPQSLKSILSTAPARYVLELNAGVTERLAIGPGSRLLWRPTFDTGGEGS